MLIQVKLGEPLQGDVLEVRSPECSVHKQSTFCLTYTTEAYCFVHPFLIPPSIIQSQSKLVSGDVCTWISKEAVKPGKKQSWCIQIYHILHEHISHVHFQPQKLFICRAGFCLQR